MIKITRMIHLFLIIFLVISNILNVKGTNVTNFQLNETMKISLIDKLRPCMNVECDPTYCYWFKTSFNGMSCLQCACL